MESESRFRMLRILELLTKETDAEHPLTTPQIVAMLKDRWGVETYRITVQNDISALVDA